MIDRTHVLPVVRQCQILGLSRSTAYYQPTRVSAADLGLMRRIGELHLAHPYAGARILCDLLRREGHAIGRRHVATLMRRMGSRPCIASHTPASGIPPTRCTPSFCATRRSPVRTISGQPISVRHAGAVGDRPTTPAVADRQLECCPTREGPRAEGGCKAPPRADGGVS